MWHSPAANARARDFGTMQGTCIIFLWHFPPPILFPPDITQTSNFSAKNLIRSFFPTANDFHDPACFLCRDGSFQFAFPLLARCFPLFKDNHARNLFPNNVAKAPVFYFWFPDDPVCGDLGSDSEGFHNPIMCHRAIHSGHTFGPQGWPIIRTLFLC